ncbi:MAG: EamA family transporter [archaeon]|nr:EamA family transporter [Nanoarchaeota archaeon]
MIDIIAVVLVLISTFFGAVATLLIKRGTNQHHSVRKLIFTQIFWLGLFIYGVSIIFYFIALKQENLSIIYPLVSSTYIWTTFFSVKFLGEKMNSWKWFALTGIIIGISLIGLGS